MTPLLATSIGYAAVGTGVAVLLERRGQPPATVLSAIVAWPRLLSLLFAEGTSGPMDARIARSFEPLRAALLDGSGDALMSLAELEALERGLRRASLRLGVVDALLAESSDGLGHEVKGSLGALRDARLRASQEVEAVLEGVLQLRVQMGLLALEGDTEPVRDRIRELKARVSALDEVERPVVPS
jgi:hypothetical protein